MYSSGRRSASISSPQGRSVGLPKSSWFHQLPTRPIACATRRPGAAASSSAVTLAPARWAMIPADEDAAGDAAPDAEAALPDRERPPPLVRHLVPARREVVEARADDPGADAPDGDAEDQIPVAAARDPARAGDRDARRDPGQQHQAVHVDRHAARGRSCPRTARGSRRGSVTADRILPTRADGVRKNDKSASSGVPTRRLRSAARAGRSRAPPGGSPAIGRQSRIWSASSGAQPFRSRSIA